VLLLIGLYLLSIEASSMVGDAAAGAATALEAAM
jgi:hypothetical protein